MLLTNSIPYDPFGFGFVFLNELAKYYEIFMFSVKLF